MNEGFYYYPNLFGQDEPCVVVESRPYGGGGDYALARFSIGVCIGSRVEEPSAYKPMPPAKVSELYTTLSQRKAKLEKILSARDKTELSDEVDQAELAARKLSEECEFVEKYARKFNLTLPQPKEEVFTNNPFSALKL